jgi:hypothetical protein
MSHLSDMWQLLDLVTPGFHEQLKTHLLREVLLCMEKAFCTFMFLMICVKWVAYHGMAFLWMVNVQDSPHMWMVVACAVHGCSHN